MKATAKRSYRSPRREAQARATRVAIVEAAITLFSARGYAATTMQAVAKEAGVAVESVYAAGSKSDLLKMAIDHVTVGDDEPVAFAARPAYQHILAGPTQREQVRRWAGFAAPLSRAIVPIHRAGAEAAAGDENQATYWLEIEELRRLDVKTFVTAVAERGPLRHGMTIEAATTTMWLAFNWYNLWLQRTALGNDDAEIAVWMERVLGDLLLEGDPARDA